LPISALGQPVYCISGDRFENEKMRSGGLMCSEAACSVRQAASLHISTLIEMKISLLKTIGLSRELIKASL